MKKEQLVEQVSDRTGVMPEVTEIVIETAGQVIGDDVRERSAPVAKAAGGVAALLLGGVIVRHLRRRRG